MPISNCNAAMNEFHNILKTTPSEDAVYKLMRSASAKDRTTAMMALCSLLMIEHARRYHAERRLEELERELEKERAS